MTPILLALLLSQNPAFVGPYTRLGTQNPSALMDAGSVLRGALIMTTDGGPVQPLVYDGRNWSEVLSATTAPMNLYVDGDGGVDTNDCATLATACRTIQAAVDRIPYWVRHDVTVNIEPLWNSDGGVPGRYPKEYVRIAGRRIGPSSNLSAVSDYPRLIITGSNTWYQPTLTGGSTGAVTAYSAPGTSSADEGSVTDSAGTWSATSLTNGNFIRMTTGPAVGHRRVIVSNTGTALGITQEFPTAPAIGNTFVIERPSTQVDAHFTIDGITGTAEGQLGGIVLQRLDMQSNGQALVQVSDTPDTTFNRPMGFYDQFRPRAFVVMNEMRMTDISADTWSESVACRNASCGFRTAVYLFSSTYNSVMAVDASFDLGGAYIVANGPAGDTKAVTSYRSHIYTSVYPNFVMGQTYGAMTQMYPVIESIGETSVGMFLVDSDSTLYCADVRATGGLTPSTTGLWLYDSDVTVMSFLNFGTQRGTTAISGYTGIRQQRSELRVTGADCSMVEVCAEVVETSHLMTDSTIAATAGALDGGSTDLILDGTTSTAFSTVDALTPAYATGTAGSSYVLNSGGYIIPVP